MDVTNTYITLFIKLSQIFPLNFLGGPGSGKISHTESFLAEHPGFFHTNAQALLLMDKDNTGNGRII